MTKKNLRKSIALTFVALGATLLSSACSVLGSPGPSAVGQGVYYSSGNPHFDEFFLAFHDTQVAMGQAPERQRSARADLISVLDAPADVTSDALVDKVKLAADDMEKAGVKLRLTMPDVDAAAPEGTAKLETKGTSPDEKGNKFISALETCANESLRLAADMKSMKTKLTKLQADAITLDGEVDQAFRKEGPRRKSEVHKNLRDAQKLVPLMESRADEILGDTTGFLKSLKPAVDRDVAAFEAPAAPPPEAESSPPPQEKHKKSRKSRSHKSKPASKPKASAPAAGPGFEP